MANWKLIKQPWINKGKGQLPGTPALCHSSLVQIPVKLKKTKTCVHTSPLWFLCTLQAPVISGPRFTPKQERDNLVLQVWLKSHSTPHAHENSRLDLTEQLTWLQSCHMRPNPNRNHLWYFNNIKSKLNSALYLTRIQHQFPWPTSSLLLSTLQGWESWKNELHSVKPHGQGCQLKCYPCSPCWGWAMKQNSLFSKSDARLQLFSLQLWLREGLASSDNIWMWSMVLAVSYRIWKGLRHDSVFLLHLEFAVMHKRRNSWERPEPLQGWSQMLPLYSPARECNIPRFVCSASTWLAANLPLLGTEQENSCTDISFGLIYRTQCLSCSVLNSSSPCATRACHTHPRPAWVWGCFNHSTELQPHQALLIMEFQQQTFWQPTDSLFKYTIFTAPNPAKLAGFLG